MKILWYSLIFGFILSSDLYGQTPLQRAEKIKNNKNYKWGEGAAPTMEEAAKRALEALVEQIYVAVNASYTEVDKQTVNRDDLTFTQTLESKLATHSSVTLTNVSTIILSESPEEVRVFRYISMEDVEEAFEMRKAKITDFIASGRKAEQRLQIDDALRYYYWALALANTYPQAVYVDYDGEKENSRLWLRNKINSVINLLSVEIMDCEPIYGGYSLKLLFKYNGMNVSSVQYHYNNGYAYMGPNKAKDGKGDAEFEELPSGNFRLRYEIQFKKEGENLDPELRTVFSSTDLPKFDHISVDIPIKTTLKKNNQVQVESKPVENKLEIYDGKEIMPEPIMVQNRIEEIEIKDKSPYETILSTIESAINQQNSLIAKDCFTDEGYEMFNQLLTNTGKVSVMNKPEYKIIKADHRVIIKSIPLKIKFKNGRTFIEDLTFRLDPRTKKISSIAFALTKKAEDDIFKASARWSQISRYTIMTFMEDYQTAYALKRLDFLESIFSDRAIIITGSVISYSKTPTVLEERGKNAQFNTGNMIKYTTQTKEQFIARLKSHFKSREYVHLTFEDNETSIVNTNGLLPDDAAFAIQIRQIYNSPSYSDKGYLTLMLNMQNDYPLIEVRTWQPEKNTDMTLSKFIEKFKF